MSALRAIGLMSGTSMDGVDVAVIDTDGESVAAFGPTGYRPYSDAERALLRQALTDAEVMTARDQRPGVLAEAEALITRAHAEAVETLAAAHAIGEVAAVGFHGQTVLHRPDEKLTVQLGDGAALAKRLGMPVVYDLRNADLQAGGQGAPLVPVFHRALMRGLRRPHPVAVLNVGGVANVTYIDGEDNLIACDTGPGNALIDDFVRARAGLARDDDGRAARVGQVDCAALSALLAHPFFARSPPKSLDRNDFREWVQQHAGLAGKSLEDGAATLTALTAATAARIVAQLPRTPGAWIVAGGGARNPTLLAMLAERVAPATVETADHIGWSTDSLEAQAFAFLAVRTLKGLPNSFPATTGAPRPMTGGVLVRP
jgi:anhydro-N-acetylmuramic acid kinase